MPWIRRGCRRCGEPLPPAYGGSECGRCRVTVAGVVRIRSALTYEYPVDQLVTRAKFAPSLECAAGLGELLAEFLRAARIAGSLSPPQLVAPVPLHSRRLAQRGFNQAQEIALPVIRVFSLPLLAADCRRIRDTPAQTTLSGAERRTNLRGAFRVRRNLRGLRVAVVDDVLTTGGTVAAFAAALRAAGAESIEIWTAARSRGHASGRKV